MTVDFKSFGQPVRQRSLLGPRGATSRLGEGPREERVRRDPPAIRANDATPPVEIPPGHVGPVVLPGTGRLVYWTGRVAIGLRHEPRLIGQAVPQSTLWVQDIMLGKDLGLAY